MDDGVGAAERPGLAGNRLTGLRERIEGQRGDAHHDRARPRAPLEPRRRGPRVPRSGAELEVFL